MASEGNTIDLAAMIGEAVAEAAKNDGEAIQQTVKVADAETLKTSAKSGQ